MVAMENGTARSGHNSCPSDSLSLLCSCMVSDTSEEAFAGVLYLCLVDSIGRVHVAFVMSKTRVAPIKRLSQVGAVRSSTTDQVALPWQGGAESSSDFSLRMDQ